MELNGHNYDSWQNYFQIIFAKTGRYECIEHGHRGQTVIVKYVPIDLNDKTEIEVICLFDKLINLNYLKPITKGFTKIQEREYFYRYDFTPDESYDGPGLEFIEVNLRAINKQLHDGLHGREIQYYRDERLIKSQVYGSYNSSEDSFPLTINFEKKVIWKRFFDIFLIKNRESLTTKEISLRTIFSGI